jgi:ssDNA-binding domain of telomere protection protein
MYFTLTQATKLNVGNYILIRSVHPRMDENNRLELHVHPKGNKADQPNRIYHLTDDDEELEDLKRYHELTIGEKHKLSIHLNSAHCNSCNILIKN